MLLHVALGDHQVAPVTAEVEARTIGARVWNKLDPGRSADVDPFHGIPDLTGFPYTGSALIVFDSGPLSPANPQGTPPPPTANVPPTEGQDPHEFPRRTQEARDMKDQFLRIGGKLETRAVRRRGLPLQRVDRAVASGRSVARVGDRTRAPDERNDDEQERREAQPEPPPPAGVLALQQGAGNRAVAQLLSRQPAPIGVRRARSSTRRSGARRRPREKPAPERATRSDATSYESQPDALREVLERSFGESAGMWFSRLSDADRSNLTYTYNRMVDQACGSTCGSSSGSRPRRSPRRSGR